MEIGEEGEPYVAEPLRDPFRKDAPAPAPRETPQPSEPARTPDPVPAGELRLVVRRSGFRGARRRLSEWGRRVRAAIVLSGREVDDVAEEIHISRRTLERSMRGERLPRPWETDALADALDVPDWFLEDGFSGFERQPEEEVGARLDRLEELVAGVAADVKRVL